MLESLKRPLAGWFACVAALILLLLAAYRVDGFERYDASVLSRLSAHRLAHGSPANAIAYLGTALPVLAMLAVICLLALRWRRPRHAVAAVALVAGANLTTQVLKWVLAHPRYQAMFGSEQIGRDSFPSGHATAAMSIALALLLVAPPPRRLLAALVGVCLVPAVCLSVLILRNHYPSDVLGGVLVATGWFFAALAGLRIEERLRPRRRDQVASRAAISMK